jgi:hypothetical protein
MVRKLLMTSRIGLLAAAALGLGVAAAPASAQEGQLMRNVLGAIGVLPPDRDPIDYRERAPLVVPPGQNLRTPQAAAGDRRANWPKDPDVEARKEAAKSALMPATQRESYIMGQRPLLSQEELRKGRIQTNGVTEPHRSFMDQSPYEIMTAPIVQGRELAARRNASALESVKLGEEPPRRFLSDPPKGLRKPAGTGEFTRTQDAPAPIESRFGQREFIDQQGRR